MADHTQLLAVIEKLRQLTVARGATAGEADTAAYKIGRMVIDHQLLVTSPDAPRPQQKKPEQARKTEQEWNNRGQDAKRNSDPRREGQGYEPEAFCMGQAEVRGSTEKALYAYIERLQEAQWIPKSVLRGGSCFWEKGDAGLLYVAEWWARKEGWT